MTRTVEQLRCPSCNQHTIATINASVATCAWCGTSWPANKHGIQRLSPPPPRRRKLVADPKPARRILDPVAGLAKAKREGRCRICEAAGRVTSDPDRGEYDTLITRHHLVPRSEGGDDTDDNIVPLCGDGLQGCHGDVEARRGRVREALRRRLVSPEVDYIIAKKGRAWLDRHYPTA